MHKNAKVTKEVINGVKTLVDAGTTLNNIGKVFDVSTATVSNIKKTRYNFKNYKQLVSDQLKAFKSSEAYPHGKRQETPKIDNVSKTTGTPHTILASNGRVWAALNNIHDKLIEINENEKIKQKGLSKFSITLADSIEETLQHVRHIDKVLTKIFPKV